MKRVAGFVTIFIIILVACYAQPILFPAAPPATSPTEQSEAAATHQPLKHTTIETTGFAKYIGQPVEDFEAVYGAAVSIADSGFFFQIRSYQTDSGILEISIEDDLIAAIKTMGQQTDSQDFYFGRKNKKIAQLYNLSADFALSFDEEPVILELSENDMRYRPLIAYDNNSFAMLFFNADTENLVATVYLDREMLLRLMPYQINSGNPLSSRMQESNFDWGLVNSQKQRQLLENINRYRQMQGLNNYDDSSNQKSQATLTNFIENPSDFLNEERLDLWMMEQGAAIGNLNFELNSSELKNLAKEQGIDYQAGLLYSPEVDATFNLFYWLSIDHLNNLFDQEENGQLNIAFQQESVLVLLQEPSTKESE